MLKNIDLKMIRTAAIACIVSIAFAVGAIMGSAYFEETQAKMVKKHSARVNKMSRKHSMAAEDIRQIGVFFPQFQTLRQRGIIGEADRVKWVETLSEEAKNLNLTKLNYAISPANEFKIRFSFDQGDAQLMASDMTLSMDLLHEEDLLDLLARLDERNQGLFIVNECEITRKVKKIRRSSAVPNLAGGCTLKWFNAQSSSGQWKEESEGGS